ncbi:hypothetical protein [Planomonospora sp. ID82291]|uniref:hypothetical protein n=1 Tax=Planomonospora sp. ID82291 TaxID=2738136 RepID=UPI0018C449A6|nr:hypothetical protein [Planomonospora sp. ID82291]MBG0819146.1 hypothetical protein [Planomonospora sp. ID82291]
MTELLRGSLTLRTAPGVPFTISGLMDMHARALMLGIPTNAQVWGIQFVEAQDAPGRQEVTLHWRISAPPETGPHQVTGQEPQTNPYPNTAQEAPRV